MKAIKRWSEKYREKNTGCVDYIDYVRYRRRQVHRIYMVRCFCFSERPSIHISPGILPVRGPLASQNKVSTQAVGNCSNSSSQIGPRLISTSRRLLPELFIWDLFHELAIACRTLSQIPSRGGSPGYELVHLDLKPGNGQQPHPPS